MGGGHTRALAHLCRNEHGLPRAATSYQRCSLQLAVASRRKKAPSCRSESVSLEEGCITLRQRRVVLLILLLLAVAVWPYSPAQAQASGPLRVGLYYNSTTSPQVTITGANGLRLGCLQPGEVWPTEILAAPGAASWLVRPESSGYYWVASNDLPDRVAAEELRSLLNQAVLAWTGSQWQVWVGSATDASAAQSLASDLANQFPAHIWSVVAPNSNRSELCNAGGQVLAVLPAADIYIGALDGGFLNLASKLHRGWLQLTQMSSRYRVINYIDIEDYLLGVVPREMSPSQPLEALKVQAVASRTFALTCTKHKGSGFDVCTTTCCQVLDHSREAARSTQAVRETAGLVVTYRGQMVPVYFHAHSGGHTENPIYVWGNSVPYLIGVPELYPINSGYEYWEERLTAAEIQDLLGQMGINVGNVLSLEPLSYTPAGRVQQLRIVGSAGSTILEKEQVRLNLRLKSRVYTVKPDVPAVSVLGADGRVQALNPSGLKVVTASGTQTLQPQPVYYLLGANGQKRQTAAQANSFLFVGSGFGHGVGISQYGAYTMAQNGHTFEEIIKYYLSGVEILKLGD